MSPTLSTGHSNPLAPPTGPKSWAVRAVLVALGFVVWHWTQGVIGARQTAATPAAMTASAKVITQGDGLLELTRPANVYLRDHPTAARWLLIGSSGMIDLLGIFLLSWAIFGSSLRPFVGLLLLFGLRQITQGLCALPPPEGMIWDKPGFPSLLVTYDVANDFFFSGHTALAVYGAIEVARLGGRRVWLPAGLLALFLSVTVIVLRAHYTMDVFTGAVAAVMVASFSPWLARPCDQALARLVSGTQETRRSRQPVKV